MQMRFQFNLIKSIEVLAHFLRTGPMDKVKLMKLVYLADRQYFIEYGIPITGDSQYAMPYGPVPSNTLEALNGGLAGNHIFRYIHVDDAEVSLRHDPGTQNLSPQECAVLATVTTDHAAKSTWTLVRETHRLPEYSEAYIEGTSRPIPYERIAKHSGNPNRFRLNRPVISELTAAGLNCPFPDDADL
jgi:uncharacterized phage-associated protein